MNAAELRAASDPPTANHALHALWLEAQGDWEGAHDLIQDDAAGDGAWVHAYLHRVEGDLSNADYWYRRAARTRPEVSLPEEWDAMVTELLSR